MSRVAYKMLLQSGSLERGSYPCSRSEITMGMFRTVLAILCRKSTLALVGAFLIHITLGTVYTLSNVNSYATSYIRKNGYPNATYGGTIWISSAFAVGQGLSMTLGGFIEKKASARMACMIGCFIHSSSTMVTSYSLDYGLPGIVATYGFLPGFGAGLSYMTPLSNAFGWFKHNQRGFVAGTILAGFGFGTFIFSLIQTTFVNPNNLSPGASKYFEQEDILKQVPGLFLFIGSIYGIIQLVGCSLLFKPPTGPDSYLGYDIDSRAGTSCHDEDDEDLDANEDSRIKNSDEHSLVEIKMSLREAISSRKFKVLTVVYGTMTQGVLFINAMLKVYGQTYIEDDLYLAWVSSMGSIANGLGRYFWGLMMDRYNFSFAFTTITLLFSFFMFTLPFEFVLSSKHLYLIWTFGIFGSFSGWMSIYPVQVAREFGRQNSSIIYGLIYMSQVSIRNNLKQTYCCMQTFIMQVFSNQ